MKRRAKQTAAAPLRMPSPAMLREWFSLPLAPPGKVKAGGMGSVPIVLPEGGKSVLAKIAWPNDHSRQVRCAGRGDPYGLSRREYLELANSDGFRKLSLMTGDLLAAWAIRAARRKPELAERPEPLLRFIFTSQLMFFLLGPEKDVGRLSGGQIVRRHLLAEIWKLTIELMELEFKRDAPRRKGTEAWVQRRRLYRARLRDFLSKYPFLSSRELIKQARQEPELLVKGKPPSAQTIRRALAEPKAKP